MDDLRETQFVPLQSQSNIFGLVEVPAKTSSNLLIATLRHGVFLTEYKDRKWPIVSPVPFSYLPIGSDVDIIALDAYLRPPHGVIVGIVLIKGSESSEKDVFFNVYGLSIDEAKPHTWSETSEDWISLPLKFMPFKLTHHSILKDQQFVTVFLLSGMDRNLHMFLQNQNNQFHEEIDCSLYFPEFEDLPSSVTAMSFKNHVTTRCSAIGCQNGFLKFAVVDMQKRCVLKEWNQSSLCGPISAVQLFPLSSTHDPAPEDPTLAEHSPHVPGPALNLLVCSAIELANVYMDVSSSGLSRLVPLPHSTLHDSVLCAEVADVNWDGRNEIILGTFGKRLLMYHWDDAGSTFELQNTYQVSSPVHGIKYCDIIGDGFKELAVLSTKGVHIFQHNLQEGIKLCVSRLKDEDTKDILHKQ